MPSVDYAILVYDIDISHPEYANFYAALRLRLERLTMPYNMSVRLLNLAQADSIRNDIEELRKHYGVSIDYKIRRIHPHEGALMREDSVRALHKQIKHATKTLTKEVDKLQESLDARKIEEAAFFSDRKVALRRAERALRGAKGLAIMFQIEQDIKDVLGSLRKLIEAERVLQQEFKERRRVAKAKLET